MVLVLLPEDSLPAGSVVSIALPGRAQLRNFRVEDVPIGATETLQETYEAGTGTIELNSTNGDFSILYNGVDVQGVDVQVAGTVQLLSGIGGNPGEFRALVFNGSAFVESNGGSAFLRAIGGGSVEASGSDVDVTAPGDITIDATGTFIWQGVEMPSVPGAIGEALVMTGGTVADWQSIALQDAYNQGQFVSMFAGPIVLDNGTAPFPNLALFSDQSGTNIFEATLRGNRIINIGTGTGQDGWQLESFGAANGLLRNSGTGHARVESTTGDTNELLELASLGANGAPVAFFSGTRDPNGVVTGDEGDLYVRAGGASSSVYQRRTAGSGTAWTALGTGGGTAPALQYTAPRIPNANGNVAGALLAHSFSPTRSMTITHVGILVSQPNAGDTWYLAIYDNVGNRNLLQRTAAFNPSVAGWQRFALTASVAVTCGTEYWVALKGDVGSANFGQVPAALNNGDTTRSLGGLGAGVPPATLAGSVVAGQVPCCYTFGTA